MSTPHDIENLTAHQKQELEYRVVSRWSTEDRDNYWRARFGRPTMIGPYAAIQHATVADWTWVLRKRRADRGEDETPELRFRRGKGGALQQLADRIRDLERRIRKLEQK